MPSPHQSLHAPASSGRKTIRRQGGCGGIARAALVMIGQISVMLAATWHVDPAAAPGGDGRSWGRAKARIAEAVLTAKAGDEVWCRAGVHDLTGVLRVPVDVAVVGGFAGGERTSAERTGINFAHETTLRQTRAGVPVVEISGGRRVRLEGFTITGAQGAPGLLEGNRIFRGSDRVGVRGGGGGTTKAPP